MSQSNKTIYDVFSIIKINNKKSNWSKIGVAFLNRDGSLNVKLDHLPLNSNAQIQLRLRDNQSKNQSQSDGEGV